MHLVFQSLVGLVILALVALGTMSMFVPQRTAKNFAIEPVWAAGLTSIRSMIAGPIVAGVEVDVPTVLPAAAGTHKLL